ncbi:nucleolar protein 16, partial [Agrilus planipennis]|uniref:Nucleolar protein 16 n=1 Tax=Agrilus planipennis TaxID=224129 RepID=A0A1W4XQS8_AGRPL
MPKIKKQHRRKVYRYNVNRKRLRNKVFSRGKVTCKEIKEAWENRKSVKLNLKEMGLSYDPNETLPIPNIKQEIKQKLMGYTTELKDTKEETIPPKKYVLENLEAEAKAPRQKLLRLPNSQVEWITYLLDKYKTDYKAMAKDKRNYYQETWKQLRAKVRMFKKIPEQYNTYLQERCLSDKDLKEVVT